MNLLIEISQIVEAGKTPAFAYDRVSSVEQRETGLSLQYQEAAAAEYAKRNNLSIVKFYTVAESAHKELRKIFNEMLDDAQRYGIRHIIFKNTDRMSRNYADLVKIEKLVDHNDFVIHFYQNNRHVDKNSNHNDRFILSIEVAVARQLSDKISHDVKTAYLFRAERGTPPGHPPWGYTFNDDAKKFVKGPLAPIVAEMFDEFDSEKLSTAEMAARLNARGVKAPSAQKWYRSHVHRILTNPIYAGFFTYKNKQYDANHEPFFSRERYYERLQRLAERVHGSGSRTHNYPLSDLLRCGECGRGLTGELKKGRYVYYTHPGKCTGNTRKQETVFKHIDEQILQICFTDELFQTIKDCVNELLREKTKLKSAEIGVITRRVNELQEKSKKLLDLFVDETIDRGMLREKMSEYKTEIDGLEAKKKHIVDVNYGDMLNIVDIVDAFRGLPADYSASDLDGKGGILKTFCTKIVVFNDRTELHFKRPFDSFIVLSRPSMGAQTDLIRTLILNLAFSPK